jgi:hypothetical protein
MNSRRSSDGDEIWRRLLYWTKEQKASERLAASILENEKYSVDPSHPLGGKDGGKDLICLRDGLKLIGAAYFPRGQQSFTDIKKKFRGDLQGVSKNDASGIIFAPSVDPAFYTIRFIARNGIYDRFIAIQRSAKLNNQWQMKLYKIFGERDCSESNVRETYTNPEFSNDNGDI